MQKKAQMTIEFTAVLAIMLILLLLIIVLVASTHSKQNIQVQYTMANDAVKTLGAAANSVWSQGYGAVEHKQILIPESVVLSSSYISNNSIVLYVSNFADALDITNANVSGNWPAQTGSVVMAVRNNKTHVLVFPASMVSVNVSGVYFNSASSVQILISNQGSQDYTVRSALVKPAGSCLTSTSSQGVVLAGQSTTRQVFSTLCSSGLHSAFLQINATAPAGSKHENVTFNIPITANIP